MNKRIKWIALLVAMMLVFVGCGSNEAPASTETGETSEPAASAEKPADDFKIVLKLSHVFAPNEQLTLSTNKAADAIRERTNGAVDIQTYPQGQLPTYKDGLE